MLAYILPFTIVKAIYVNIIYLSTIAYLMETIHLLISIRRGQYKLGAHA